MNTNGADRRALLADAAIEVIGTNGLRALTHRAAEREAGLPAGTCSYHFPTRQVLLVAIHQRIADLENADIARLGGEFSPKINPAKLIDGATAILAHWLGPARARTRAGLLLRLDPPSQRLAGPVMAAIASGFVKLAAEMTGDVDRAQLALALIDGIIVDELARGDVAVDPQRLRVSVSAVAELMVG